MVATLVDSTKLFPTSIPNYGSVVFSLQHYPAALTIGAYSFRTCTVRSTRITTQLSTATMAGGSISRAAWPTAGATSTRISGPHLKQISQSGDIYVQLVAQF